MSQPSKSRQLYLYGTAALLLVSVLFRLDIFGGGSNAVVVAHDTIPVARQRLEILRRKAATVPGKLIVLKQVQAELQQQEQGIVQADTAEQARAHLAELVHRTALANGFDTRGAAELPESTTLGKNKDYGQVAVGLNFNCGIDQFVNFLAAIANEPQILATDQIVVAPVGDKNKNITVRLILAGVMPKNLVPVKKGDDFR